MPRFIYKAVAAGGEVLDGEITAENREAAMTRIRAQGVVPVSCEQRKATGEGLRLFTRTKATTKEIMLFTRQLSILISAGTPLDRSLEIQRNVMAGGPLEDVASGLLDGLKGGASLAEAMEERSDVFPRLYVGMVRAGEAGGALAPSLERLATMLERAEALRQALRSALIYPTLVLVLTGVSLVVMLVWVVPEFKPMFADSRVELPISTQIVIGASDFALKWGWAAAVASVVFIIVLIRLLKSATGRIWLDQVALASPMLGDLIRRAETSRFTRTLSALITNGVPLLNSVEIAAGALGNSAVAAAARQTAGPLSKGEGLARPLAKSGYFPDMAVQLIEVGEESGRLPQMLEQVADIYDRETATAIQRMLALLTPLVTIFLGMLIAFIIGSILSAILGSYSFAL
jgi:general secretion pathway protein F